MAKRLSDIAGEAVLLVGGARAILLQIANPAVGVGVVRHSDFGSDPLLRLRNTLTYVYIVVFGTADEATRVTTMVNAAHSTVRGSGYDAVDPDLQLWVAATLYDTAITVHQSVFGTMTDADADAVYRDYAVVGTALQMRPDQWPADRTAFTAYWDGSIPHLSVTDDTRRVARELLHSRAIPWWLRAVMPLARLVTAGLLTPELRDAYQLPWNPRKAKQFDRTIGFFSTVYPRLPRALRRWPMRYYIAEFRRGR
jgi:uncharacterized protein (DUF2236 family)